MTTLPTPDEALRAALNRLYVRRLIAQRGLTQQIESMAGLANKTGAELSKALANKTGAELSKALLRMPAQLRTDGEWAN
jgi:hypothetical protein